MCTASYNIRCCRCRFIGGGGDGSCDGGGCCISGGGGNCGDFVVHRKAVVAFLTIVAVMELRR
ncbi:hypothetical protein DPMN_191731 [Dreissena polymorpha]|uniref:Uncharacterized protein n=1 Tax=Dreissena polymorpha TaxID=45954 RepID=A0A9D3Y4M4_DREPO|nr:hypothetical protein DPMN_191731 [Dreissena polymorpha]